MLAPADTVTVGPCRFRFVLDETGTLRVLQPGNGQGVCLVAGLRAWLVLSSRHLQIRCSAPKRLLLFLLIPAVLALVSLSQPIKGPPVNATVRAVQEELRASVARGGPALESQLKTLLSPAGSYDHRSAADLLFALRYEGPARLPVPLSVLLMLVMTAVFSGTLIACLEICGERPIYRRERLSHLAIVPYLASKLPFCLAMSGLQCLLFLVLCWTNPVLRQIAFLPVLLTMVLLAWSSVAIGLCLSAADPADGRFSVLLVIAAVLPQLILSGGLGPDFYAGMHPAVRVVADLLPARHGLEMVSTALFAGLSGEGIRWIPGFVREVIGFDFGRVVYYTGIRALFAQSLLWIALCAWFLKRQDTRGPGTPVYMGPERIDPQTFGPIGPTIDLYAVGIILFELLAGRPPFQGPMTEIFTGHLMQAPDLGLLPLGLTAVVGKALAKPSSDRYPDAVAFLAALEAVGRKLVAEPVVGEDVTLLATGLLPQVKTEGPADPS